MCFPQNSSAGKCQNSVSFLIKQAGVTAQHQHPGSRQGAGQSSSPGGRRAACHRGQLQAAWLRTSKQPLALLLSAALGAWASKTWPAVGPLGSQKCVGQRKLQPYWYHFCWLKHHLHSLYICTDNPSILVLLCSFPVPRKSSSWLLSVKILPYSINYYYKHVYIAAA